MDIHVSTEEVRDLATRLSTIGDEINTLISNMHGIVIDELPSVLTGLASESYVDQYNDLEPSLIASRTLVEDISVQLNSIVTGFEDRDSDMSSQVGV